MARTGWRSVQWIDWPNVTSRAAGRSSAPRSSARAWIQVAVNAVRRGVTASLDEHRRLRVDADHRVEQRRQLDGEHARSAADVDQCAGHRRDRARLATRRQLRRIRRAPPQIMSSCRGVRPGAVGHRAMIGSASPRRAHPPGCDRTQAAPPGALRVLAVCRTCGLLVVVIGGTPGPEQLRRSQPPAKVVCSSSGECQPALELDAEVQGPSTTVGASPSPTLYAVAERRVEAWAHPCQLSHRPPAGRLVAGTQGVPAHRPPSRSPSANERPETGSP